MRIARSIQRIADPERSLTFYVDALGMTLAGSDSDGGESVFRLSYPSVQAVQPTQLELRHHTQPRDNETPRQAPGSDHSYWKIGLTLADVDLARARLHDRGIRIGDPMQFEDIGYLCHLADPDGYAIELLQHRFAENHVSVQPNDDLPLGSLAAFGQITLRVKDAEASLRFYRERLGLTLLSRQPVPAHRFTLYFLSAVDEPMPDPDLEAVGNREWLWQRPYTTLELQHHWDADALPWPDADNAPIGFHGVVIETDAHSPATLRDPDGNRVVIAAPPA